MRLISCFVIAGVMCADSVVHAEIVAIRGSGASAEIEGANLDDGQSEVDGLVVGYDERQSVVVTEPNRVWVDYLVTSADYGVVIPGVDTPNLNPRRARLPVGTYASHILHFDPVGTRGGAISGPATFDFDGPIVAVIANTVDLIESDALFGAAAVYEDELLSPHRRAESADFFQIIDADTLQIEQLDVGGRAIDEIRVLTRVQFSCEDRNPCTTDNADLRWFYFPASRSPNHFIQCSAWQACTLMSCPGGLVWDPDLLTCNFP